jgi:hypothetical protein
MPLERNYFAALLPALGGLVANPFVRGGVSGIGLVTFAAGVRELVGAIAQRQAEREAAAQESAPRLP